MNAYFMIVLIAFGLFFVVWGLGWLLERLSHKTLNVTHDPGSKAWYMLVGPGVALHESSHALGCIFTRTEIVEFKPINVSIQGDQVVLGYVKYRKPASALKNAVINLAPVGVSLVLLIFFALGATYLVPSSPGIGGAALELLQNLIIMKNNPALLGDPLYPIELISDFVYTFIYTVGGLTVVNPLFWIVSFFAMTIMFSNAPSDVDIKNAATGLKIIIIFNLIWLAISYFIPLVGWILFGVFELLAVMFSLALSFAIVAYGFFILITLSAKIKKPFHILPFIVCITVGVALWVLGVNDPTFLSLVSPTLQTILSVGSFLGVALLLLFIQKLLDAK